jgi:hypothetical protein
MKYAIIENGVVVNTVITNAPKDSSWIQSDTGGIGWAYADGVFTAPAAAPVAPVRILSKVEYLKRLTQAERINIRAAAAGNAVVDDYVQLLNVTGVVNLDDPDTIGGLNALESAGLLSVGRAAEILA